MESPDLGKAFSSSLIRILLLLAVSLHKSVKADEKFCPGEAIVNLTDASGNGTGFFAESGQFFPTKIVWKTNGALRGCICDIKPCVSICIPLKKNNSTEPLGLEHFRNVTAEIPSVYTTDLTLENDEYSVETEKRFHRLYWEPCVFTKAYFLDPDEYKNDEWHLLKNGSLFLPRKNGADAIIGLEQYCFRQRRNHTTYTPRVCSPTEKPNPFRTASYIGGLVSVPFLIATIFVYSVLPELRNIHGNTFRCYLCCLLATYVALAADRIPPPEPNIGTRCLVFGFLIYFSFLSSFLWLNIMCFDMWWRFGGYGSLRSSGELHDRKKFIGYSIYAWGTATILTAICIGLEFSSDLPEFVIKPGFQQKSCWFSTNSSSALYFFGPVGVTIVCNICVFVSTSIKLVQHKRNTQRQLNSGDSQRHDDNRLLFTLYLKLFVIMGLSWSTEVISGLWKKSAYIWYFTDMVNALQGILIFITFVCKKNILHSLEKRYKCLPRFSRNGLTFTERSTDSRATISSLDDSTPRGKGSTALSVRNNTSPESCNSTKPLS